MPLGILIGLLIGFLFFYSVDAAAQITNNDNDKQHSDQSAWIDTLNNVVYKPNPPSEYIELPPKVVWQVQSSSYCSCVAYAKSLTGFSTGIGTAKRWPVNSPTPTVAGVVITLEGPYGHVAIISGIEDGFLILSEANYSKCKQTNGRRLSIGSPLIIGYWSPNN